MRLARQGGIALAVVLALLVAPGAFADERPSYKVIVHPASKVSSLSRSQLARIFLKKRTRWSGGRVIKPADLHARSAVRRKFSDEVLRRSIGAVRSYWQQAIFSGRDVPPPEFSNDWAVVSYVLRTPGAIGYVSAETAVGHARVIGVR